MKAEILITRQVSDEELSLAKQLGLTPHVQPAIAIEPRREWSDLPDLISHEDSPLLAFTSRNAVRALKSFPGGASELLRNRTVYAVGNKTASELRSLGCTPILPEQFDGSGLAKKITEDLLQGNSPEPKRVLHLCGNMRRNEFRQFLEGSGMDVRDVVVYRTELVPMTFDAVPKNGLLFYSPSAVHSFRNSGGFTHPSHESSKLFAIGHTTAEELSIETGRDVYIPPVADSSALLRFTASILFSQIN